MKCIGYGKYERKCQDEVEKLVNPVWCPRCDKIRRKTITKQLEEMRDSFNKK